MIQRDNEDPILGRAPWFIALIGLTGAMAASSMGCSEELEITNAPATVVAAGNISGPIDECPRVASSRSDTATDAGDASTDAGDTSTDAGDASTDAGDASTDAGDASTDTGGAKISQTDGSLVIPYLLRDPEGDDQNVKVELCQWDGQSASQCGVAVQARGGDGSRFVPTTPAGACVLHLFYWDVGCGRFVGTDGGGNPSRVMIEGIGEQLVARVSIVGSDESPQQTEPFSLEDIGFESLPECE